MRRKFFQTLRSLLKKYFHLDLDEILSLFKHPVMWWSAIVLFALAIVFITTFSIQRVPDTLIVGQIANSDIKADRDYEIIDEEVTEDARKAALDDVPPVYNFDEGLSTTIVERVRSAFAEARKKASSLLRCELSQNLGITIADAEWKMLLQERFSEHVEKAMIAFIGQAMKVPLVAERGTLDAEKERGAILRRTKFEEGNRITTGETKIEDISTILSTEEARAKLTSQLPGEQHLVALARKLIEPNCTFDRQESERRHAEAMANVKNVIIKVTAGEMIIRNGSRFEPSHIKMLQSIQRERSKGSYPYYFIGNFIVVLLFLIIPFSVGERYIRRFHPTVSDYFLMASTALATLFVLRISLSLAPAIQQVVFFSLPDRALNYAIPLAAGTMLIRMLLSAECAFIFAIPMAFFVGLFPETGFRFVPFSLLSSLAAVLIASKIDRRTMIIRAGLFLGLVNAIAIIGLKLIGSTTLTEPLTLGALFWVAFFAFLGGATSAIVVMISLPAVESLTGYVTDIKLLELANLNHPLLRELIVRAPGTYHHSHLVGVLGETAAEAIGANALLVRVAAYYHDIGKMKKPAYFSRFPLKYKK